MHIVADQGQIDSEGIVHRFTRDDNYLIGSEVKGKIVKFQRVLPMPDVESKQLRLKSV